MYKIQNCKKSYNKNAMLHLSWPAVPGYMYIYIYIYIYKDIKIDRQRDRQRDR